MRRAPVLASLLAASTAFAEPPPPPGDDKPQDPRDAFGLPKRPPASPEAGDSDLRDVFGLKPKPKQATACRDVVDSPTGETAETTFGCTTLDPFDDSAPMAARTWLPASYLLRLPVADARHDQVAHFSLGASLDDVGPSFGGATGLENAWTIEGAPIESLRTGNVETRVPLTFLRGIRVTAGGFGARDRVGLGGAIDAELLRGGDDHVAEAYAWAGYTEDARERPIAPQTYQLRRASLDVGPEAAFSVVGSGPLGKLVGGRAWYAAGVAGNIGTNEVTWRAASLVDADGDGVPDGLPGLVTVDEIAVTDTGVVDYLVPTMVRAGWARGPHDLTLTAIANFSRDSAFLANATQQAAGVDRTSMIGDGIATWTGSWKSTHARVIAAWHRSVRSERAHDDAAGSLVQFQSAYVPTTLADDPALAAACDDTPGSGDIFPTITNCPIPFGFFASAGAGLLVDSVGDRPTLTADVAHRVTDHHVLRAGGTFEDSRLVQTSRFSGGELVRSLLEGHTDRTRFLAAGGECMDVPEAPCDTASEFALNYRTRYTAAFVEDTFAPVPTLQVNTGVRWELMWVGPSLHFSNQLAPRLGIAWDVLEQIRPGMRERTTRWWASMGRTHALLPAGLGQTVIARNASVRDVRLGDIINDRIVDVGNVARVCHVDTPGNCDGIDPATQDEFATGFEIGFFKSLRGNIWLARRSLRRGLETVLANQQTGEVFFDNPGRDGTVPALRESTTIAADVMIAPSDKLSVRVTYLWGQTFGSWTGAFDPRQGAVLYNGTDWDLDARNLYGRLPTDPSHRVAIEGERRGTLGPVEYAVSTRLTVAAGRPRDVLGASDLGIIHVIPRGSGGRNPTLSQANVRLAARWRAIDFTLDVFNAFDRRDLVTTNDIYADGISPVVGGSYEDLVFAKNESCGDEGCSATTPRRRTTYGLPTSFQNPRAFVLGVHHEF